jgi:hypothetical protein
MILLINCDYIGSVIGELGVTDTRAAEEYYGYPRTLVQISIPDSTVDKPWWVNPRNTESMRKLTHDVMDGELSPKQLLEWVDTPAFVARARQDVNRVIRKELGLRPGTGFDKRLHEAVRLVVIGCHLQPSESDYVRRVFDGYFRNAKYWHWRDHPNRLKPLWRAAKVTELKQQPTRTEALDVPARPKGFPGDQEEWERTLSDHMS